MKKERQKKKKMDAGLNKVLRHMVHVGFDVIATYRMWSRVLPIGPLGQSRILLSRILSSSKQIIMASSWKSENDRFHMILNFRICQ